MKGTEKQLKWVEDIKANAISCLENEITRKAAEPLFSADVRACRLMIAVVSAVFDAQADAAKIIDRRGMFAPAALFATCDRWADMLRTGRIDITTLAARNGLKNYKED